MPGIHLIATPEKEDSLAKAIGRTHYRYTQYVNALHGRSGHLWQNRFYSCALGEEHFWTALAYVERNPVRARLCRKPWRYVWSSARAHCEAEGSIRVEKRGRAGGSGSSGARQDGSGSADSTQSGCESPFCLDLADWRERIAGFSGTWREALEEKLDEDALARVRLHLSRGRPLGGDKWIARLESRLGRRLHLNGLSTRSAITRLGLWPPRRQVNGTAF